MSCLPEVRPTRLSIVIVSYRCLPLLRACLASLRADGRLAQGGPTEVIVVDSGSGDGTAEAIAREVPEVRVIACAENVGFARGNNLGIAAATGELVLLLNPDTVVPAGSIEALVRYLRARRGLGAVGPRLLCADGRPQIGSQRFPSIATELARQWRPIARLVGLDDRRARGDAEAERAGPVDWVSGACLLVTREALARTGLLDEGFFLYFEETDWCRRARAAGLEVHYVPEVEIVHIGGQSAAAAEVPLRSGRAASHFVRSRRRYFRKHHGLVSALAVEAVHAARAAVRGAKRLLRSAGRDAAPIGSPPSARPAACAASPAEHGGIPT